MRVVIAFRACDCCGGWTFAYHSNKRVSDMIEGEKYEPDKQGCMPGTISFDSIIQGLVDDVGQHYSNDHHNIEIEFFARAYTARSRDPILN